MKLLKNNNIFFLKLFFFACTLPALSQATIVHEDSLLHEKELIDTAYGKISLKNNTASLGRTQGDLLQKTFSHNIHNALIGTIAGLTITQGTDEPGLIDNTMLSRGMATYTGVNDVLVLVDGFESSMSHLVAEEIETVTLLKDAAATAIYGLRGANGVLLVTTKKGKVSPLRINFSTQIGFQTPTSLPKYLGSADYARLFNEAQVNDGVTNVRFSEQDIEKYATGSDQVFYPNIDWYNTLLRKQASISKYNLNFTGGNNIVRYFVLMNYFTNNGLLIRTNDLSDNSANQSYRKYNIRSNLDLAINNTLDAEIKLGTSVEDRSNPGGQNMDNLFNLLSLLPSNSFPVYNPNGTLSGNGNFVNPMGEILETGFWDSNARNLNASLKLTQKLDFITKGLSLSGALSFNSYFIGYSNKIKTYERYPISQGTAGEVIYGSPYGLETSLVADEGHSQQWRNSTQVINLDYNRIINRHKITALFFYNFNTRRETGNTERFRHVGLGGRVGYSFDNRYLLDVFIAHQGSENFPVGKQYGTFPAVSVGWVLSEESFLQNVEAINFLKLRASYGLTGNDRIGGNRFMFEQQYYGYGDYFLGRDNQYASSIGEGILANPNVTWEKETKMNFGVDLTLFNKLSMSLDYFNNDRSDILSYPYRNIPTYIGIALPLTNLGKVNVSGMEATLNFNDKIADNLEYNIGYRLWYSKNKIVFNSEAISQFPYQYTTGLPIFQPFGLISSGFYSEEDLANPNVPKPVWQEPKPGDLKYIDQNNDNVIDGNDWYPMGKTSIPELSMALDLSIKFRSFDFFTMLHAVGNRSVYLDNNFYKAFQQQGNISEIARGRWTPQTAGTATYPRLSAEDNLINYQTSTFWQKNGNFLKLRNLEIGYTLDTDKIYQDSQIRFFLNGTNILTLDHIKYFDSERLSGYPSMKTYSAGFKLSF